MRENRRLLVELENYVQTNYSIGKSEAQDLLNAQLQVSKLDEKLQANQQVQRRLISQLSEWLGSDWLGNQAIDSQALDPQGGFMRPTTLIGRYWRASWRLTVIQPSTINC